MSKDAQTALFFSVNRSSNQPQHGDPQAYYQPSTTSTLLPDVEAKTLSTSKTPSLKVDNFLNDAKIEGYGEDTDGENDSFMTRGEGQVGVTDEKEDQIPSHHGGLEIKVSQRKKWGLLALFSLSLVIDRESNHRDYSRQLSN